MPFAFNEDSERQFLWLLKRYPTKQACLLPAFRLVEAQQGCVDDAAKEYLATRLDLAPAFVHGVFTFYTHYRRAGDGKFIVQICRTLPCALRGSARILEAFKQELGIAVGQTTPDGLFSLRTVECLGSCASAPIAQINDDYFEQLTPEKVKEIVAALREGHTPPHLSNGPTLEGGCRGLAPLVEASPEGGA
jgi:NADH-quinone oxidoreductase E subunit